MNTAGSWWKEGVIYQIYPRSFCDSNGDGVGDLRGITGKLEYLQELGVDAIWLSPVNTSPMFDFGYDVSDYRAIAPVFGTMRDMDRLIERAHGRGIRVIMDLVVNHTSHLHPWFLESRSSKESPKRDWYLWHDGRNRKAPNNWRGVFGGRAWERDGATGQYYLHSFLKEQPDLNWRNRELREAVYDEFRFWLDRGVDGFRLDVANYYVKDELFRDNPVVPGPHPRPYDWQRHLYDRDRPETQEIFKELRDLTDGYGDRVLVGEIYTHDSPATSASYIGNGADGLHLTFDFSLMHIGGWRPRRFFRALEEWDQAIPPGGWPCNVLSNHDNPRMAWRVGGGDQSGGRLRVMAALLLASRGTPFLYYGEEIGMTRGEIPRRRLRDPLGIRYWPFHGGRDPDRTPMQWDASPGAGFTAGDPWLPVNRDYRTVNVERQMGQRGSLFHFHRSLIALRREIPALRLGEWIPVRATGDVLAFIRSHETGKALVMLNFSAGARAVRIAGDERWDTVFSTHRRLGDTIGRGNCGLAPYEVTICEMLPAAPPGTGLPKAPGDVAGGE
ncbi:MAG: alpha-glucosidase [Spirochaetes bacterium]|nr:alpha-glucosidase [Spirochaetota bacterium]